MRVFSSRCLEKANLEQSIQKSVIQKTFLFVYETLLHQMEIWDMSQKTWIAHQDWFTFLNKEWHAESHPSRNKLLSPRTPESFSLRHPFSLIICLKVAGWNGDCLRSLGWNSLNLTEINTKSELESFARNHSVRIDVLQMADKYWLLLQPKFQTDLWPLPGSFERMDQMIKGCELTVYSGRNQTLGIVFWEKFWSH